MPIIFCEAHSLLLQAESTRSVKLSEPVRKHYDGQTNRQWRMYQNNMSIVRKADGLFSAIIA